MGRDTGLRVVRDREKAVSNQQFLEAVFGDEWGRAHVTSFADDPENIPDARRGACWGGGRASRRLRRFRPGENQYFTISLFHPHETDGAVRRKAQFDACFVIVADDVREKIPEDRAAQLPPPSYKLVSSEGSEQWGWILAEACENRNQVENLLDGLVALGLAPDGVDPGMKGVTRYVRLPEGVNTKARRFVKGRPFRCYISDWNPQHMVKIEDLARVFGIDLDADRLSGTAVGLPADDPIVRDHPVWAHLTPTGYGADGWIRVDCPNVNKHSVDDPSGAAVQILPDGRVNYKCHHGHCNGETGKRLTGPRMLKLLDTQHYGGSGAFLDRVDDYQKALHARGLIALETTLGQPNEVIAAKDAEETDPDRFDRMRYVFLASENKFFDIQTGNLISPVGLNNLYSRQLPKGRNRLQAAAFLLSQMDQSISSADGIGWRPTGITAPSREDLIYEDNGARWVNKWQGFAARPTYGDVAPWLDHAEYLLPNARDRGVVLDYLAAIVQRLDSKPGFFLGHRGSHRVGKDMFYKPLLMAMGTRCSRTVDIDKILDGWGDYIDQLKFVVVTEVDKVQDRKVANAMKTVTAPTASGQRTLNMKGGRVSTQLDCMGGVMMSNKRAFLAIERGDERYFIVDSWIEKRPADYYRRLDDWYAAGGATDVLGYLLTRDITEFDHRALPYLTDAAVEMMDCGRYDYEQDLEILIEDGVFPFCDPVAHVSDVRRLCREQGLRGGNNGIDEALRKLGWVKMRGRKKIDGKTVATKTFYTDKIGENALEADIYDFYNSVILAS